MKRSSVDTVLQVRLLHEPGTLARVATAIAEQGGLLCEIETLRIGDEHTLREITVETDTVADIDRVVAAVKSVDGAEVLTTRDRVIEAHHGGKIRIASRIPLESVRDLRTLYTPGVAQVVRAIQADPSVAWTTTWRSRAIGIFTDGTRVLGLGNVGPLASLPVMEGKAVLYDRFADLSGVPILLNVSSPAEFIETVVRVSTGLAAIHLEDIRSPDCFEIETRLRERLRKPVFHDDQHGTATAVLAAIINATKVAKLPRSKARVGVIGLGAAGTAIAALVKHYGVAEVVCYDPDAQARARVAHLDAKLVGFEEILDLAHVVVAVTGRPRLIDPGRIRQGQIILALSNPDPEIDPKLAIAAGAALASDGRAINNALAFPGLMRGAIEARSYTISNDMMIEAARVIASRAEPGELVPSPLGRELHEAVAVAVARSAVATRLGNTASP